MSEDSGDTVPKGDDAIENVTIISEKDEDVVSDEAYSSILSEINEFLENTDLKCISPRQAEFTHLIETERNYVSILVNIVKNFKEPCEKEGQAGSGPILVPVEVKNIFRTIIPIYTLHRKVLRDLAQLLIPWSEENLIGKVYCDYATSFSKAYEPFVNFYEATKAEILRCEAEKPRFMEFLRTQRSRRECEKQTLQDLMIRPIQRLPSTALILSNLFKHTREPNPDKEWISKALETINFVNKAINEGKRVTEGRIALFDIYNEIEGCPVDIISAHRTLLLKIDVISISDIWGPKNDLITLVVFNDFILIVRRRASVANKHLSLASSVVNLRSPSMSRRSILPSQVMPNLYQPPKPYKFLEIIYHLDVSRVVDVYDATCFALIVRAPHEHRERTLGFTLPDDPNWSKAKLLNAMAKLAADAVDRLNYEVKLVSAEYGTLDFCGSSPTVLEKASRFATKTRRKVTRALTLSGTPRRLKRTVSQMMSPFSGKRQRQDPDTISCTSIEAPPKTPLCSKLFQS